MKKGKSKKTNWFEYSKKSVSWLLLFYLIITIVAGVLSGMILKYMGF